MADTKISAAADIASLVTTDMLPVARSGSSTAYHATMAEVSTFANTNLPTASTTTLGAVKVDGSTITIASGVISGSVVPTPYTGTPAMDGSGAAGASGNWSRGDHVHPSDVTKAPLASPAFTGTPSLPTGTIGVTQTTGNNSTALATTAFVQSQLVASGAGVSTWNTRAGAVVLQQSDIVAVGALEDVGRNRLHNVGFTVNQRNYATGTALAAAAYGHDRWKAGSGGCTYTFTASPPLTTITITAGSLQQIIEAAGVEGGTYTLSWTGTALGRVNAGTYAASPVTVTGLAANTAIAVEFNAGTLSRAQLEYGSVVTPLDRGGSPADQLRQCQRYFQTGSAQLYAYNSAGATCGVNGLFPVTMRASPTITPSGTGGANYTAFALGATNNYGWVLTFNAVAAGAASWAGTYTASADL